MQPDTPDFHQNESTTAAHTEGTADQGSPQPLSPEQRIEDIYDKKGGALEFVVRKTRVSNQRGEHVADLRAVTVLRHG